MASAALTYRKSGVDIDLADKLVDHIQKKAPAIGGFAGLFPLDLDGCGPWDLVACTDGVGTKLKLAFALDKHDTIGIDLVAMSVNDLVTCGAKPLIFLDYYATGKLSLQRSKRVIAGIMEGCRRGRCVLLGGETAEMPGMYPEGEYDLAGFAVGIVKRSEAVDGSKIYPGDLILGLPSSGLHSNGYSLARRVFKGKDLVKWGKALLTPTRIYVDEIQALQKAFRAEAKIILGLSHITGGGLVENVPRILPRGRKAVLRKDAWKRPPVFGEVQRRGNVPEHEMWRTFNMGIGMIIVIRPDSLEPAKRVLPEARLIGEVVAGRHEAEIV
ncbi:MAG TPA: phosphoribosylformylglycinamidine cyclo-ligase [Elusimicrobia bacterium]|nr:MAG: phosphoribosylformylglycinamidine cyclo-ligase [Elusimicrobia bacterium GWA2_66_18]OGR75781.1 MAG: phosphoribosylformylglycinamidine cyclo-ligase [Elusimicrobia bacterium GWC2_65_9]HAZ08832.1 phosphoribosylformylglycinamidine cyclo-ligase [Elusimicrobiota bacterium]